MAKRHQYLLDTNILMNYPDAIYGFDDNEVIITGTTLEELDHLKSGNRESAMEARTAIRALDQLRIKAAKTGEKFSEGVAINNGKGIFRIENDNIDESVLPQGWDIGKADNKILSACKKLGATLVSEDRSLLIKAQDIDVDAQVYRNIQVENDEKYTGRSEAYLSEKDFAKFAKDGDLKVDKRKIKNPVENEYFVLHNSSDPDHTLLARYNNGYFHKLKTLPASCKVKPRNVGQHFAIDALMDPDISCVILAGEAGTAKTFLAVTAGMIGLGESWDRILATRNNVEFDSHSLGALPGDERDKVSPLLRGMTDNLYTYLSVQGSDKDMIPMQIEDYLENGGISIESISFLRGRSLVDTYCLLEECQNTSAPQIKSILTRAGRGTKMVLTGDVSQIDAANLTPQTAGITAARHALFNDPMTAQIEFLDSECVRSDFARSAAARFEKISL